MLFGFFDFNFSSIRFRCSFTCRSQCFAWFFIFSLSIDSISVFDPKKHASAAVLVISVCLDFGVESRGELKIWHEKNVHLLYFLMFSFLFGSKVSADDYDECYVRASKLTTTRAQHAICCHKSFFTSRTKVPRNDLFILNCWHFIAFQSLLPTTEDYPSHFGYFFCSPSNSKLMDWAEIESREINFCWKFFFSLEFETFAADELRSERRELLQSKRKHNEKCCHIIVPMHRNRCRRRRRHWL